MRDSQRLTNDSVIDVLADITTQETAAVTDSNAQDFSQMRCSHGAVHAHVVLSPVTVSASILHQFLPVDCPTVHMCCLQRAT